jgi:hypothetical protein
MEVGSLEEDSSLRDFWKKKKKSKKEKQGRKKRKKKGREPKET